jgi:hypothetical protein
MEKMMSKPWDGTPGVKKVKPGHNPDKPFKQPLEIEIEILKSKLNNLEENQKWLTHNWVEWTKSTKDMGQKLIILFEQLQREGKDV